MTQPMTIPYIPNPNKNMDLLAKQLNTGVKHLINNNPWNYEFSGEANFNIAYTNAGVLLKFNVIEENILSRFTKTHDPVYKDSCVEFFVAFNNQSDYYNFEFNCTGTCLAGYGASATSRELLHVEGVKKIEIMSSFKSVIFNEKEMVNWELMLLIPNEVFQFHDIKDLSGQQANVNFYKCGDDLPSPHYLCWHPITGATEPNFHLPNCFGKAVFLKN